MIDRQSEGSVKDPITIAIVGGGASGTITLNYLVEYYGKLKPVRPIQVYVFEKSKALGVGIAYGTDDDNHILNMRSGTIDIFPDKPGHFMGWLTSNAARLNLSKEEITFDSFLPRKIVGIYLKECLDNTLRRAKKIGIVVKIIHEEVYDFCELHEKQRLYFNNTTLDVDYTVFCLGNLPSTNYPQLYNVPEYFHTPWELDDTIRGTSKPIGILGASLTAIDTALSLAPATMGPLYFIAPNGRLPKVLHIRKPFVPQFVTIETVRSMTYGFTRKLRLEEAIELFRKEIEAAAGPIDWSKLWQIDDDPLKTLRADIAKAEKGDNHWHTVLADTSLMLPLIWENLYERDKKRFYRHYYAWWRVYRVSMPLQNAKKVLRLLEDNRLTVIRNLQAVEYDSSDRMFTITHKKDDRSKAVSKVAYVIDATGTGFDVAKSTSKLMHNMIENGLLTPHPMGGVKVNPKTLRLVKQAGEELHNAFFFGMLTKGVHFYTNALDANAVHGERVAKIILNDIRRR